MRLAKASLSTPPFAVDRFGYDRDAQAVGIVHFGIGAFHRAHQAWYIDRAMDAGDRNWLVAGVSLRSRAVADQMNPQDGLFSVTERSAAGRATRIVGAVRNVVAAVDNEAMVERLIALPTTRIISFTVTEKGYCRAPDGTLDPGPADENSIFRFLVRGLRQRRDAGLGGVTLLSCDNLSGNGAQLAILLGTYLDRHDPSLRTWFEQECASPSTMVDRIVPATTDADRAALAQCLGLSDEAAVMTEPFSQWIIEDRFAAGRPRWELVGAELVTDVRPYETAKLRMLNGAHSALAYLGLERGHTYVHEAVADPAIAPLVERLMRQEAAPTIDTAPGQDLQAYAASLLTRFANPALNHRLEQIAMDGSQKLPQRWLDTLAAHGSATECPAIMAALAAWLRHVRGDARPVDDPQATALATVWKSCGSAGVVPALFGTGGPMAGTWAPGAEDIDRLTALLDRLG